MVSALLFGCGPRTPITMNEVPEPGASTPYGLMAIEVEVADTHKPQLTLKQLGYIDRAVTIHRGGTLVMRMRPGVWQVQVEGTPKKGDVIKLDAKTETKPNLPRGWPKEPLTVTISANKLTSAGRVCAHAGCKADWGYPTDPRLAAWKDVDRYLEVVPPTPPDKKKDDKEPDPKTDGKAPEPSKEAKKPAEPADTPPANDILDPGADP